MEIQLLCRIFHEIDKNKDGYISPRELRVFIIGISLEDDGLSKYFINAQQPANHVVPKVPNTSTDEGQSLLGRVLIHASKELDAFAFKVPSVLLNNKGILGGCIATEKELQEWSGEIGSDIPFFFSYGAAYCTCRGEIERIAHIAFQNSDCSEA
ncbi:hypothetical protein ACET3Z_023779 [Daucus carota]